MPENRLLEMLDGVRRRVLAIGAAVGSVWAIALVLLLLTLFAWGDLALDLPSTARMLCAWLSLACGAGLLIRSAFVSFHGSTLRSVARRVDHFAQSGGQILSGVDLIQQFRDTGAIVSLPAAMAAIAVRRAEQIAAHVRAAAAVPAKPLFSPSLTLGTLLVAIGIVALAVPRLVATEWLRFMDPYGDHPPYSAIQLVVEPGDARVIYGGSLDVRATPKGGPVDHLELTIRSRGLADETVPMFAEIGGAWRATVSQVTTPGQYFVHGPGVSSYRFRFDVITMPEFRDVRVRITPPPYTHLPPYTGPMPQQGLAGLVGAKVELWAVSNRPLSAGKIQFALVPTQQTQSAAIPDLAMSPTSVGGAEVMGSFEIKTPGKLKLTIVDTDGQPSPKPYVATITVLKDERPFVRILDPKANSFATPDARIDVNISAEDDYGISSVQLFRGLNEMRATPQNLAVPPSQPTRLDAQAPFNLAEYGLSPGDVVKLYARVEDNDPAGPKGSESPVVTLHIISTEEFNRMAVARNGLETLEAKYSMAARRLEALDDAIAKLQQDLKKLPPDSPLAKDKLEAIRKLARQLNDSANEVADAAKDVLPFDIDKEFTKHLADVAKSMRKAAEEAKTLAGQSGLSGAVAGKKLDQIRKDLGAKREQFKKQVTQPLDNLDKIFPLIEDQARFVDLWQHQQDLAERMKSIINADPEDPRIKGRMRDLEAEQRQISQDLNELLDDIRNHAVRLPVVTGPFVRNSNRLLTPPSLAMALAGALVLADDPTTQPQALKDDLEKLQQTAFRFVRKVRASGAIDQMNDSAADLDAFDGVHAAAKAQQAADTLKKFIGECKAMAGNCRSLGPLVFQPQLCHPMDSTIDQLLSAEGMGVGPGSGAGGGFSQRRSTLRNTGLYGRIPMGARAGGAHSGHNANGAADGGNIDRGAAGDAGGPVVNGKLRASGDSDVAVPPEYKQKVGEYFRRVADELGQ